MYREIQMDALRGVHFAYSGHKKNRRRPSMVLMAKTTKNYRDVFVQDLT